jgi:ABC-type amino acid transport substrate-binding protein
MIRILILFLLLNTSLSALEYTIAISTSCPYYCPKNKNEGYIVDILRLFFKEHNHTININQTPYARLKKVIEAKNSDLGIMTSLDLRNSQALIAYKGPLGHRSTGIISREVDNLILLDFNDLKSKRILIPKGSQATLNIISAMNKINKDEFLINEVTGSSIHSRLIDLVSMNRGDVALDDYNVLKYNLKNSRNRIGMVITPTSLTGHNQISVVSRKDSPLRPLLNKKLNLFINKIRKSGVLKKILNNYGISDWGRFTSR